MNRQLDNATGIDEAASAMLANCLRALDAPF
jgi:hypothetical protein